jgi:hypothetical protein
VKGNQKVFASLILAASLIAVPFLSQTLRRAMPPFRSIPDIASPQLDALGARVLRGGKELTTMTGEYSDETGRRTLAQAIHQLPNLVMLRGFSANHPELKFDGRRHTPDLTFAEQAVLDTFMTDLPEGMLASMQDGAAVRLLGRGFKPSTTASGNYAGVEYDIFEVVAASFDPADIFRMKFYYFDSNSGLLASTRYSDTSTTPPGLIETRFAEWRAVDGSAYPGKIERYKSGRLQFSFAITTSISRPAIDVANFR